MQNQLFRDMARKDVQVRIALCFDIPVALLSICFWVVVFFTITYDISSQGLKLSDYVWCNMYDNYVLYDNLGPRGEKVLNYCTTAKKYDCYQYNL